MGLLADVGGAKDTQAFGVGGHDPVLDAVVHHLDEVPGAARPAVQISLLGCLADLLSSRRACDVPDAGPEPREDRVEALDDVVLAADHHAVPALQAPDAAARAHVDVVNAFRRELLRPADIVDVVGIAAVDQDVAAL